MELTTEDREDHTFNGTCHRVLSLFFSCIVVALFCRRSRPKKKNSRTPPPPPPGIFFDVEAATSVPLQYIEIQSVFVRGMLGKMTVWTSDSGESEKKFWKRSSKETIVDEETGEEKTIFTEFDVEKKEGFESEYLNEDEEKEHGLVDRYTTNGGYHRQQLWKKVFEDEISPSRRKLKELVLDAPIRVERGKRVGIYVHSAEGGDQGIVYDNVAELRARPKRDGRVIIHPGIAHLSFKPFGRSAPWGGISLRKGRQFVGKLGYAVRWMLWSEVNHHLFPIGYKQAVKELIKGNQLDEKCALSILPPEIMFAVLNKSCGWDWFGSQMRKIKRADGKSLFPKIEWSDTCGRRNLDRYLSKSSRRVELINQEQRWGQILGERREYFTRALKIFRHLMHEEYIVRLKKRLANSISSDKDEDEDLEDEKSEEEEEEKEEEKDEGKRNTRASTAVKKPKKASKSPKLTKEEKIEKEIDSAFGRILELELQLQEFVFHHTLDNLARELENLDLLIEEGFCDSKDEVDRFLTHSQLNQNLSTDFHKTSGLSRNSALQELVEMNGGRRIEFESGSNISGLYDRRVFSGFSDIYMPLRVHELMPGSIIAQFEKDLSHIHGNQIWYGNHGPTLGGLGGGAFEDQEYSTSEEDDYISEEEYYDEEDEFEYSYYHEEGEEYGEEL